MKLNIDLLSILDNNTETDSDSSDNAINTPTSTISNDTLLGDIVEALTTPTSGISSTISPNNSDDQDIFIFEQHSDESNNLLQHLSTISSNQENDCPAAPAAQAVPQSPSPEPNNWAGEPGFQNEAPYKQWNFHELKALDETDLSWVIELSKQTFKGKFGTAEELAKEAEELKAAIEASKAFGQPDWAPATREQTRMQLEFVEDLTAEKKYHDKDDENFFQDEVDEANDPFGINDEENDGEGDGIHVGEGKNEE